MTESPDCHYGDHTWMGGGACVRCGKQLRCYCGCFIREDGIDEHLKRCPWIEAIQQQERETIERTFAP